MAVAYPIQVSGTAQIQVSANNANSYSTIGYSVDGVFITINNYFSDLFNDLLGPMVPCDTQYMGCDAVIKMRLINILYSGGGTYKSFVDIGRGIDSSVNAAQTFGELWYVGDLLLQNSLAFQLQILPTPNPGGLAASSAPCWRFFNCRLDGVPVNVGVRASVWDLTFRAIPNLVQSGSSYLDGLFTQTCS